MMKTTVRKAAETPRKGFSGPRSKTECEIRGKTLVVFRSSYMLCKPTTSVCKRRTDLYHLFTQFKLVFTV